ncbi:methyl-accepting chemotaxis protein [uncultured Acetatifactor sp.]|jgi:methyl-accepting chemotaxis protein|uniref:methyl-accepting chemotaxis protein n=1 Tax=uncultured Acetatifactor sp. TaxID=1671927 RepID=UPI0025E5910E|nr:methyl-accepting chemotaxis protein [uncultured Acetatifactor sp.]MCI8695692.1 methyl-accepting chemotaxis protein [Lachnospiraceae bacterium]MCI9230423.1 methyl-accepting chemotaxis protein [Lachnospiraceae bacterium]MCI9572363.1 methyl-accepting chemotaxis protein [Lachnospiraceae bacterium]
MKNLKIRTKLLATFMLVIILFIGTVAIAIYGLQANANKYSEFYNVEYKVTNNIMSMRRGLQIIVKDLAFITIESDESKKESYQDELQTELTALEENAYWLFENFTGDSQLLDSFSDSIQKAMELQENVITTSETDNLEAQRILLEEYQPLVQEAVNTLIQISAVEEKTAEDNFLSTVDMQELLVAAQIGMAVVALIITILLSTYLTRSITKPLRQLETAADKIVNGNFDISVTYESKDELGSLTKSFKNMTFILETVISDASRLLSEMADGNFDVRTNAEERYVGSLQSLLLSIRKLNKDLSITLGQINQSADQVASGSGQVSNGAQALAQGATEQAASVEELASTITNISYQVKSTADNAMEARSKSNTAGGEAEICNNQMHDMMDAMEEIARSSNEISKIIKTIEDIAFQTNILALNAAVEAARAGEAGKGFAVVAEEVRSLASKSSVASKNTAELIESSVNAVTRGTKLANSTAESLVQVVNHVRSASTKVDEIANAAEEQAGAIEQVTLGVDQISSVVQTNSATAEESAAASQELSEQASTLKSLVAKFKLREEYIKMDSQTGYTGYGTPSSNIIDLD